jgi:outer membrane protein TolC
MTVRLKAALLPCSLALAIPALAQAPVVPPAPANAAETAPPVPFSVPLPHSANPFSAYLPSHVPEPDLANSPRLDRLIRDGKLYLSLQDAIALALENNLDLAIARYNLPIAAADVLRTRAGAPFLGVNTGVVQNTPGGGVGGLGAGAPGAGAGGTTSGAGGAGAGAGGLVQSTYGGGTVVNSFDPRITSRVADEHATTPEVNTNFYGVPYLRVNTETANAHYFQSFPSGTSLEADFYNSRQTVNSPFENLTPAISSEWRVVLSQELLAGFGFGPNLRYLRIAKNDQKISDSAFRDQVVATATQIADIYWDLVAAYQDEQVKERSRAFAEKSLEDTRKQFELQAVPQMDVMKAEAEVAKRDQDLTIAKTTLQLQQSLIKNALTKRLDENLEEMPVIPTASMTGIQPAPERPVMDLIAQALKDRPELYESQIDLQNRQITRKSLRNALLPTLNATAYYSGTGLAGMPNPAYSLGQNIVSVPADYPGALSNAFNNSSPDYLAQLQLSIPLRNRQAKADQFRSELEYRQAELRIVQLQKQIRIEVRNAAYALEQNAARVEAASKARDLAQRTFDIMKQEQQLGAGSSFQTLSAEHDLGLADSALVAAESTYEKSRIEVDRATGATLDRMGISIAEAKAGIVSHTGTP